MTRSIFSFFSRREIVLTREESDAFVEIIRDLVGQGDIKKAIHLSVGHQRKHPHDKPGICNSAIAISTAGRPDIAIQMLSKANEDNPGEPRLIGNLGAAYYNNTQIEQSLEHARESVRLAPDSPNGTKLLADVLCNLNETEEARALCANFLENYDPDFMVRFKLGVCELQLGNFQEAANHFEQSLEMNPEHTSSLANLGAALIGCGDFDKAESIVLRVLEKYPDNGISICNLAQIFESRELYKDAYDLYCRSIEVDPNYEPAHGEAARLREFLEIT